VFSNVCEVIACPRMVEITYMTYMIAVSSTETKQPFTEKQKSSLHAQNNSNTY